MGNAPGPKPFLGHPQACVIGNRCNRVVANLWLAVCVCESVGLWVWWGNTGVYDSCAGQTKSCSNRVWGGPRMDQPRRRGREDLPYLFWRFGRGAMAMARAEKNHPVHTHTHALLLLLLLPNDLPFLPCLHQATGYFRVRGRWPDWVECPVGPVSAVESLLELDWMLNSTQAGPSMVLSLLRPVIPSLLRSNGQTPMMMRYAKESPERLWDVAVREHPQ